VLIITRAKRVNTFVVTVILRAVCFSKRSRRIHVAKGGGRAKRVVTSGLDPQSGFCFFGSKPPSGFACHPLLWNAQK
jgi:hypothetical protein